MDSNNALVGISCRRLSLYGKPANGYGVLSDYVKALSILNLTVLLIPPQTKTHMRDALSYCDGLLLPGGENMSAFALGSKDIDPERDDAELYLAQYAKVNAIPVLGICRGVQIMNVASGGSVTAISDSVIAPLTHVSDVKSGIVYSHRVECESSTNFLKIVNFAQSIPVNCRHSYCVGRIGDQLQVVAHSSDDVIEAIEGTEGGFYLGVQWHPECLIEMGDKYATLIFDAFVQACHTYRQMHSPHQK